MLLKNLFKTTLIVFLFLVSLGCYDYTERPNLSNHVKDWRDEVVYMMFLDRFNDGDETNNRQIHGNEYIIDHIPGNGQKYQGGDFRGVIDKLDYLQELGITTIWITQPVKQAWDNAGYTSYHGYWTQDFQSVDPHLGTMEDFRELIHKAHKRGIKVTMDVVVNHIAQLFYYSNAEGNQWEPEFNADGKYEIQWLEDVTDFGWWVELSNRVKPMPEEFQNPDWYSARGGNCVERVGRHPEEFLRGDILGLRDIDTSLPEVRAKMIEIFKWWIQETNIDGFRLDAAHHVDPDFWYDFCADIRNWAASDEGGNKNFFAYAEMIPIDNQRIIDFVGNNGIDSVAAFYMYSATFGWDNPATPEFEENNTAFRGFYPTSQFEYCMQLLEMNELDDEKSIHDNGDGLTARQKALYFFENHDTYRFLNNANAESGLANEDASEEEIQKLQTALAWLLTWEGLPILLWGTEQNYKQAVGFNHGGKDGIGNEANSCEKGARPRLWEIKNSSNNYTAFDTTNQTFKFIKNITKIRKRYSALRHGKVQIKWTDNDGQGEDVGILAYVKTGETPDDDILIVINLSDNEAATSVGFDQGDDMGVNWQPGTTIEAINIHEYDDDHDGIIDEADETNVFDGTNYVNELTTYSQEGKTSAVYMKLPARSVRIFKKK